MSSRTRLRRTIDELSRPEERQAWIGILETHDRIIRALDAELKRAHGLSYRDVEALARVQEAPDGEMSVSALARHILLSPSRVSRLVAELEQLDLVERRTSPNDGRTTVVAITRSGRDRLLQAGPTYLSVLNELLFDRLTRKDVEALNRVWRRLAVSSTPTA